MNLQDLKFFASAEQECGYLPNQKSVSLFADPDAEMSKKLYSELIEHGFRRSGKHIYRPYCSQCDECVPIRVDASQHTRNRNQRRNWKLNSDLAVTIANELTADVICSIVIMAAAWIPTARINLNHLFKVTGAKPCYWNSVWRIS
jgi:arginyl-tRNA--protein-N-Asp/Glu arginylyltransferase